MTMKKIEILLAFFLLMFPGTTAMAADEVSIIPVGELEVLALPDAEMEITADRVPDMAQYPAYASLFARGPLAGVTRTFFLQKGDRKILFDTGWGSESKKPGRTLANLESAGVKPGDITDMVLTHMDVDHVGGLIQKGQKVFPNATLWISSPEVEAWQTGKGITRGPRSIAGAREVLKLYGDRLKTFEFGDEILPGITAVDATGHTPGHTAFDITDGKGAKLTLVGDVLQIAPMQLPMPQVNSVYDMDGKKAAETRERLLKRATEERSLVGGMHLPMVSPVLGRPDGGYAMREPR